MKTYFCCNSSFYYYKSINQSINRCSAVDGQSSLSAARHKTQSSKFREPDPRGSGVGAGGPLGNETVLCQQVAVTTPSVIPQRFIVSPARPDLTSLSVCCPVGPIQNIQLQNKSIESTQISKEPPGVTYPLQAGFMLLIYVKAYKSFLVD